MLTGKHQLDLCQELDDKPLCLDWPVLTYDNIASNHEVCPDIIAIGRGLWMLCKIRGPNDIKAFWLIVEIADDLVRHRGRIERDPWGRHLSDDRRRGI